MNVLALNKLYRHAKKLDDSRLVTYVSNRLYHEYPTDGNCPYDATSYFDMMMFNEYFSTWYRETTDAVPGELDKIAKNYPDKPLTITEWGLCEPFFKGGDSRRITEMKKLIDIYSSKDYISGAIYFCLNDYRTHMGEDHTYQYPQRVHGVCDIHLNPKASYDTLRKISSPVILKSFEFNNNEAVITLSGNTGIPSYVVRDYSELYVLPGL